MHDLAIILFEGAFIIYMARKLFTLAEIVERLTIRTEHIEKKLNEVLTYKVNYDNT
jgi:hypothetical protein